jgi:CheY-like chemotaxis protein
MRFLIVEDDERVRRMIKTVVADLSEAVYECSDGSQAHASYAEHLPDWVLMDLMMPEVDGIAATRQIRSSYPAARIVIVTSHESSAMRNEARNAGACGYVLKEDLLDLPQLLMAEA